MKADLQVIGFSHTIPRYVVSGGTKIRAGEPVHNTASWTSGVASVNTFVLAAANTPVIGTHSFGGIAIANALLASAGTTLTQYLNCAIPVPDMGRIRGKATTVSSMNTASLLAGIIGDVTLINYSATGASDGGPLYTIIETATANTSGLQIVGGNTALGTLDVVVEPRAIRNTVS